MFCSKIILQLYQRYRFLYLKEGDGWKLNRLKTFVLTCQIFSVIVYYDKRNQL